MHHEMTVRVILLNERNEVLLQRISIDGKPTFFITPGGRVEEGDTALEESVFREIEEETGISRESIFVAGAGPLYVGHHRMVKRGVQVEMTENFFVARVSGSGTVDAEQRSLTEEERGVFRGERWFSLQELQDRTEIIVPVNLADLVSSVVRGDPFPAVDFSDPPEFSVKDWAHSRGEVRAFGRAPGI